MESMVPSTPTEPDNGAHSVPGPLGAGQGHRQPQAELVAQTADSPAAARRRHIVTVTAGYYQPPPPSSQPSADRVAPVRSGARRAAGRP